MKFPAIKLIRRRNQTSNPELPKKNYQKFIFGSLLLLVAMFGSSSYLLLRLVKSDATKDIILAQLEEATGREVTLEGDIDLALSWKPTLKINGVTVANADWGQAPYFLNVEQLLLTLDLAPLLQREISVTGLNLERPIIYLEKNQSGINWEFLALEDNPNKEAQQLPETNNSSKAFTLSLPKVTLENGELRYQDLVTEKKQELLLTSMEFNNQGIEGQSSADIQGYYQSTPFSTQVTVNSLQPLLQQSGDTKLTLALALEENTLEADGTFSWQKLAQGVSKPGQQVAFTGAVTGLLSDIDAIAKVSGVQLPAVKDINFSSIGTFSPQTIQLDEFALKSPDLQVNGNAALSLLSKDINQILNKVVLEGNVNDLSFLQPLLKQPQNIPVAPGNTTFILKAEAEQNYLKFSEVDIKSDNVSLKSDSLKASLPHGDAPLTINGRINLQSADLGSLLKQPGYARRSLKLNGIVAVKDKDIALNDLLLSTPNSNIMGSAGVILPANQENIPNISFDLTAPKILVADFLSEEQLQATQSVNNRLFSDTPLNLTALNKINAQGQLSIGALHLPVKDDAKTSLIFNKIKTSVRAQDGNWQFDNLSLDLPGSGSVLGTVGLSGNDTAALSSDLQVSNLILGSSLKHFGISNLVDQGSMDMNLKLNSRGNSLSTLAANASGLLGVNMTQASLSQGSIAQTGNELFKNVITLASNNQATTVNCLVSSWQIKNGIATTDLTVMDSTYVAMQGSGSVNLGQETLDIVLAPRSKNLGQFKVAAPISINGSLSQPKISSDLTQVSSNLATDLIQGKFNPQKLIAEFVPDAGNHQTCGAPVKQNVDTPTTVKQETLPKLVEKKQDLESQGRKLLEDAIKLFPGRKKW
ncbi:MAG: AsmA family protein [Cyanobacteria bacterium J06621_8]